MEDTPKKVAILTNMLAPYRIPVFNSLNGYQDYIFKIGLLSSREGNREWRVRTDELLVPYEILPGVNRFVWRYDISLQINLGIWGFLSTERPEAIILGGYAYPAYWLALLYGKVSGCKLVLWSGSTMESTRVNSPIVRAIRSWFIRAMNAYVSYGTKAAEFIVAHGVDAKAISIGYNVGDVDFYSSASRIIEPKVDRPDHNHVTLVFVGQLIDRKGLHLAIPALASMEDRNWTLLVVGTGPERNNLELLAREYGLPSNIKFMGFRQRDALARIYATADILLFPSTREPAGIVLSEALAAGVFTLASEYSGIAPDIIQPSRNGLFIDPLDKKQMVKVIEEAIRMVRENEVNKDDIRKSISEYQPGQYADAIIRALDLAMGKDRYGKERSPSELTRR